MYNITSTEFELWQHTLPHKLNIVFENSDTEVTITEADVIQNGFVIDRYSVSGNRIEIGSMIAAEMSLTLDNRDGRWNSTTFEGAQMHAEVSVTDGTNTSVIPLGYFTIDGAPRRLKQITLTALDRMMQFDKSVTEYDLQLPATPPQWVAWCCAKCNVPLDSNIDYTQFPCFAQEIDAYPEGDITYRQILSWAGEIMGVCGWIDYNGQLTLGWYKDTGIQITAANRRNSDISEAPVTLTGLVITDADNVDHLYASDGYALHIEGNELVNLISADLVGIELGEARQGFSYYPFVADVLPMPFIWPMDMMTYVANDTEYPVIISNVTYAPNAFTSLEGQGESATSSGYSKINPLTRRESAIIRALDKKTTEQLAARVQQLLNINDLASNSLGFWTTHEPQADGSTIEYSHNKPELADSTLAFKKSGDGFFVSYDGGQTWTNGFGPDGTAVVNILSAVGIQAEWVDIDGIIARINADGTQSIDSSRVNIDGQSLNSIYTQINADIDELREEFQSQILQTAQAIMLTVTRAQSAADNASADIDAYKSEQGAYLQVTASGVEIDEQTGSDTHMLLTGTAVSFPNDVTDESVATYGASGMKTPEAVVEGNLSTGNYKWLTRASGMALVYIGD